MVERDNRSVEKGLKEEKTVRQSAQKYYIIFIFLGAVLSLVAINVMAHFALSLSADMTDGKRFSLSAESREEARKLTLPLYITIYYSEDITTENPVYARYADFVRSYLEQYQKQNPHKIFITVKNPKPYSDVEKEAQKAGITPFLSAGGQTNLYFGATFSDSQNHTETIPSFSLARNFWLEKDITTVLAKFNRKERDIVGLISPVHPLIEHPYGQQVKSYALIEELSNRYDILQLADNVTEIPVEVKVLLVVLPRKLSTNLHYALDQYVLRGGRLILLLDGWSEEPFYKTPQQTLDDFNLLLAQWGMRISHGVLGALEHGRSIFVPDENGGHLTPYPLWLELSKEQFNAASPIINSLKSLSFKTALTLNKTEHDDDISVTPLIEVKTGMLYLGDINLQNKNQQISAYQPDGRTHAIAWLSEGKYQSFFSRPPQNATSNIPFLYYSAVPSQIMVVGDSDFIRDDMWLENGRLNDNGQFILRAIEIFSQNEGMAALYKSQTQASQESLGHRLYSRIYNTYAADISRRQNELNMLQQELEGLRQSILQKKTMMNAATTKRLNEIREKIKADEEQLRFYNYDIKNRLQAEMNWISFVNILGLPIILVLVMILGYYFYSRHRRRQVEEKFNAR